MKKLNLLWILIVLGICISCNARPNKDKVYAELAQSENLVKENTIQVALLLDTSNSMDGLIDQAKAQLWQIVNELSYAKCNTKRPSLEIALFEYGNDNLSSNSGFIREVISFTSDLDAISERLFSLTTNGGSEYCGKVIQTSLDQLTWKKGEQDLKLIFIAGNEPFTQGPVNYIDAATNAKEKDVTINTIFCGDFQHGISSLWQDGALKAQGDYMSINQNTKTVHIASPFDDEILKYNKKLNKTYIHYGKEGDAKRSNQLAQDYNAISYGTANAVERIATKSSGFYNNRSWDLIDAEAEDDFEIDHIDKKSLPKELQKLDKKELQKVIDTKRKEREEIKKKINELNIKRKTFVAKEQQQKNKNNLENALIQAIKKQAAKKAYSWE